MAPQGLTSESGLDIRQVTVRYPRAARPVIDSGRLSVPAGVVCGLAGTSGSGKTTLLHAAAGLVPWLTPAELSADIRIGGENVADLDPGQRAHLLSTCLDRPEAQLFLATVRHELAAAGRRYGRSFVDRAAEGLALGPLLDRRVTELSTGERQRVALAVALVGCPRPVLLDEPTAHLDAAGESGLAELVLEVAAAGGSVLLTEQAGWRLGSSVTGWYAVENGRIDVGPPPQAPTLPGPGHQPGDAVVLGCRSVSVARSGRMLIRGVDLELRDGEVVLLSGANGSGKSTLARVLAGLDRPAEGSVSRAGRVALVLPDAALQLFSSSVAAEVSVPGVGREEQARVLRRHRLEHLAARAPWTLSRGEQQRLVHAALDLLRPSVMIVDEPAQGLDPDDLAGLVRLIRRRSAKGRCYLLISHRTELAAAAHRHLAVDGGRIVEVPG